MSTPTLSTQFRPYRAVLAGFCGSTIATVILLFAYIVAQMLAGQNQAAHALAYNTLTQSVASNIYLTALAHFFLGIAFAFGYAKVVDHLPGHNSWRSGLVFSVGLWLLSAIIFFPLVGAGFFGMALQAGVLPVAGSLVLHLAYGATLGLVYSPAMANITVNAMAQKGSQTYLDSASWKAEKAAALGILGGTAVGVVVVALATVMVGSARTFAVAGLPVGYTLMAVMFFCIGMGMLIGFWTGAPDAQPAGRASA